MIAQLQVAVLLQTTIMLSVMGLMPEYLIQRTIIFNLDAFVRT